MSTVPPNVLWEQVTSCGSWCPSVVNVGPFSRWTLRGVGWGDGNQRQIRQCRRTSGSKSGMGYLSPSSPRPKRGNRGPRPFPGPPGRGVVRIVSLKDGTWIWRVICGAWTVMGVVGKGVPLDPSGDAYA